MMAVFLKKDKSAFSIKEFDVSQAVVSCDALLGGFKG